MKRTSLISFAALMLAAAIAAAQNPPAAPKPAPEMEKLKYFVGAWKQEGSVAASHMPGAGKYTGTYHNAVALGGFFVELHSTGNTGTEKWTGTSFLGYNAAEKVYTYDEFNSTGEHILAKGTLEGDTWTWTSETKMGGQTMNGRYTEKINSPTSYDFKFEASTDGGKTWATFLEGKSTKVGTAAAAGKPAVKAAKK
jgi:uncharacterized protein DUF1579